MLNFDISEYQVRLNKTKEVMIQKGLDVLIVTDPANMNYISGYDGWSFYVHQGLIIFLDKDQPVWFGREQDSNGARITTWLDDENIIGYQDHYVQSQTIHPYDFVADLIKKYQHDRKNIGVEKDNYYFTAQSFEHLKKNLPNAVIKDGGLIINWVRAIKSPKELEYMKMAGQILEKVMKTAVDMIEPGVREGDAAAEVYKTMIAGTRNFTGDYSAIIPIMPSGRRTTTAHLSWTDRRYKKDEIILLELSGCKNRYHAPLSRTIITGKPSKELDTIAKTVIHGLNKVVDFIKPGIMAQDIEAKWREAISGSRVVKESRIGYAFGLNYPPDWGEHTISLRPGDTTIIKPGMTIHVMPGIWTDTLGFECSEAIYITDKGCETFSKVSRQLFVK
ncbi:MAG: M24 family metallopeptidase [Deltaproteobacteria bacterium]|jgi:ectoine hydrolase|nr:M24 family metallopeptidase [Deltaproteobacteria bacterium]